MKTIVQKGFLKIISSLFTLTLFFSCSSEKRMLDSYIGKSENKLEKDLGKPYRTLSDKTNGKVLIYVVHVTNSGIPSGGASSHGGGSFGKKTHYNYYRFMYTHPDGTIYK
jgi:hypothetical protein